MKEKISVSKMSYKGKLKYKTIIKVINGSINKFNSSFREKIVNLYKDLIFIIKQNEKFSILEK